MVAQGHCQGRQWGREDRLDACCLICDVFDELFCGRGLKQVIDVIAWHDSDFAAFARSPVFYSSNHALILLDR